MTRRNYRKMNIHEFGSLLLDSGDLDPVYVALAGAKFPKDQMRRWLVAYWCFYSAGFASWVSEAEGETFWDLMEDAGRNEKPSPIGGRWPRGRERRHFRGETSARSLRELRGRYPQPEDMVRSLESLAPKDFPAFAMAAQDHSGFGPWIAFKMADMLERLFGSEIAFDSAAVFMYAEPRAGAELWTGKQGDEAVLLAVDGLTRMFGDRHAPPGGERFVGLQEIETILCKWKSHQGGHYPPLSDVHELHENVEPWGAVSATAERFAAALPALPPGQATQAPLFSEAGQ